MAYFKDVDIPAPYDRYVSLAKGTSDGYPTQVPIPTKNLRHSRHLGTSTHV